MRVGVVLDGRRSAAEIAELARLAETYGLSHVWLSGGARTKDHFVRLAQAAGGAINCAGAHYRVTGLFSPWSRVVMDRLYLGANRPRMLRLGARKADGVMVTDMPLAYLGPLVARIRTELAEANRDPSTF